jgi:beta-glucosidase
VVLHNGSPVEMPWIDSVSSVLEMHLGGEGVGEATAKILFGDANPSGKLAESFPIKLSDNPSFLNFPGERGQVLHREGIYVGYRYYDKKEMQPLFPFGHGLSYSQFSYSALEVDKKSLKDDESLAVAFSVKNIGEVEGKEVAQLYVGAMDPSNRPIRELQGFEKVLLKPGEEKAISFTLSKRSFAYYEPLLHDWHVETGRFSIEIGSSSRDMRLRDEIEVVSTVALPVAITRCSTVGEALSAPNGKILLESILKRR